MATTKVTSGGITDATVSTADIANDAVTSDKIADDAILSEHYGGTSIDTEHIANGAITGPKIAGNTVGTSNLQDQAVTLAKLPHGTSSNDGKFLRANNGADPTFETVNTDLVSDTSPQLGGNLDANSKTIFFGDSSSSSNNRIKFGTTDSDLQLYHDGSDSRVAEGGTGNLILSTAGSQINLYNTSNSENLAEFISNGAVHLYHNNDKTLSVSDVRVDIKRRLKINNDAPNSGHGMAIGQWDGSNHRIEGDSNRPMFITSYNSTGIKLGSSGSVKATVTSDGLTFNGDTAAANALDDYEEGTWTPNVAGNGSGSYAVQHGFYTKVGNIVHLSFYVSVSSVGYGVNYFRMAGIPFTCASNGYTCGSFMSHNHTMNNNRWYSLYLEGGNVNIVAYGSEANAAWEIMSADSTFQMIGQITYRAS